MVADRPLAGSVVVAQDNILAQGSKAGRAVAFDFEFESVDGVVNDSLLRLLRASGAIRIKYKILILSCFDDSLYENIENKKLP